MEEFAIRRNKLIEYLDINSIAIIPAAKVQLRSNRTEYLFRQNSDFYYLTGYQEPDAICVLIKGSDVTDYQFVLFGLPKNREEEIWSGCRVGQDEAKSIYQANEAYTIEQTEEIMPQLLKNKQVVYFAIGNDLEWDQKIINWIKLTKTKITNTMTTNGDKIKHIPRTLQDVTPIIAELRLHKSEQELEQIRRATEITSQGHIKLMHSCQPGLYEYQLEAVFIEHCMRSGCRELAYPMVVAGGNNACTLHYTKNDKQLVAGELVLIDAGSEYNYYASDITRTIPVNGKFSKQQKAIYNIVLRAQMAGLQEIKPGNLFSKVQPAVVQTLVNGLVEIGILHGDIEQLIKEQAYRKFYMHRASHWLGLDVHDVGDDQYYLGEYRQFEAGMVLTVEPGLYIAADAQEVEDWWRGIGVRIEDVVLVTSKGYEVLTTNLPRTVEEIEHEMSACNQS